MQQEAEYQKKYINRRTKQEWDKEAQNKNANDNTGKTHQDIPMTILRHLKLQKEANNNRAVPNILRKFTKQRLKQAKTMQKGKQRKTDEVHLET